MTDHIEEQDTTRSSSAGPGHPQRLPRPRQAHHDEPPVPDHAMWREGDLGRRAGKLLFAICIAAAGASDVAAAIVRTAPAAVFVGGCIAAAVLVRGLLVSGAPQTVELRDSLLLVTVEDRTDSFNLAEPLQPITLVGTPGKRSWQLRLMRMDGTEAVITDAFVDSRVLAAAVEHYRRAGQSVAEERRRGIRNVEDR